MRRCRPRAASQFVQSHRSPVLEKADLISAIADQSDLSLAEAASAVEFVLLAMRPGRGPLKSDISSAELWSTERADLPLLQVLQGDRLNVPSAEK